jgi:hypothetical protein
LCSIRRFLKPLLQETNPRPTAHQILAISTQVIGHAKIILACQTSGQNIRNDKCSGRPSVFQLVEKVLQGILLPRSPLALLSLPLLRLPIDRLPLALPLLSPLPAPPLAAVQQALPLVVPAAVAPAALAVLVLVPVLVAPAAAALPVLLPPAAALAVLVLLLPVADLVLLLPVAVPARNMVPACSTPQLVC